MTTELSWKEIFPFDHATLHVVQDTSLTRVGRGTVSVHLGLFTERYDGLTADTPYARLSCTGQFVTPRTLMSKAPGWKDTLYVQYTGDCLRERSRPLVSVEFCNERGVYTHRYVSVHQSAAGSRKLVLSAYPYGTELQPMLQAYTLAALHLTLRCVRRPVHSQWNRLA